MKFGFNFLVIGLVYSKFYIRKKIFVVSEVALKHAKIAVIGLGYVGLPLAVEFGKKRRVIGYDVNRDRVAELRNGLDKDA